MKKYVVIGGQYESHYYGQSDSIRGAKVIAGRNKEHWDNWQGWHTPKIYRAEDVQVIESNGRVTSDDGVTVIVPKPDAEPVE